MLIRTAPNLRPAKEFAIGAAVLLLVGILAVLTLWTFSPNRGACGRLTSAQQDAGIATQWCFGLPITLLNQTGETLTNEVVILPIDVGMLIGQEHLTDAAYSVELLINGTESTERTFLHSLDSNDSVNWLATFASIPIGRSDYLLLFNNSEYFKQQNLLTPSQDNNAVQINISPQNIDPTLNAESLFIEIDVEDYDLPTGDHVLFEYALSTSGGTADLQGILTVDSSGVTPSCTISGYDVINRQTALMLPADARKLIFGFQIVPVNYLTGSHMITLPVLPTYSAYICGVHEDATDGLTGASPPFGDFVSILGYPPPAEFHTYDSDGRFLVFLERVDAFHNGVALTHSGQVRFIDSSVTVDRTARLSANGIQTVTVTPNLPVTAVRNNNRLYFLTADDVVTRSTIVNVADAFGGEPAFVNFATSEREGLQILFGQVTDTDLINVATSIPILQRPAVLPDDPFGFDPNSRIPRTRLFGATLLEPLEVALDDFGFPPDLFYSVSFGIFSVGLMVMTLRLSNNIWLGLFTGSVVFALAAVTGFIPIWLLIVWIVISIIAWALFVGRFGGSTA